MPEKLKILIADDEPMMRKLLSHKVKKMGFHAMVTCDGQECIERLQKEKVVNAILLDLEMPRKNGMQVLEFVHENFINIPVIMVTAVEDVRTAVKAIKIGAYDYLTKPVDPDRLGTTLQNALQFSKLKEEVGSLEYKLRRSELFSGIIGESKRLQEVFDLVDQVLQSDANVLIIGESGTGKELLARAIHEGSRRGDKAFVPVNCAAVTMELADSLLFGHKKGSFTGAIDDQMGYFEQAHEGTLFLDEVGDMPLDIQAKVLRILEEKTVRRIGERKERIVDFRVIAATNRELTAAVCDNAFRQDLYYRLEEYPIYLPPLRERKEDIPLLAQHYIEEFCNENNAEPKILSQNAMFKLMSHSWPGNIRELKNVLKRAVIRTSQTEIEDISITEFERPGSKTRPEQQPKSMQEKDIVVPDNGSIIPLDTIEREAIQNAYSLAHKNTAEAAKLLGISRATMYRKLKKLGLEV